MREEADMANERYVVENQDGDDGAWNVMAATDDLEHAKSLLTSRHRRIVDSFANSYVEYQDAKE